MPAKRTVHEEEARDRGKATMTEIVLPSHTNVLGTIFGGQVMSWIDIAGAIAAVRYARSPVVTVSIDSLRFHVPIKMGYTVSIRAQVTYAGKTSVETYVAVEAENSITGEIRVATSGYVTYVAVDEFGRPKPVPKFVTRTPAEKKAFKEAEARRASRLTVR